MADPFQPKFVDLVRNFTTTTGTGNIVLGAAVTGFRSLTGAVAAGDRFYYCVMGVDRPAEREVGRGTLMANGTVAREPLGEPATSFTSGTKTIALVAAAEWFERAAQRVTPQIYGAKADGISDDAIALQAWLDQGSELHLPAAHYYSSQKLIVRKQVNVVGAGYSFDRRQATIGAMAGSRIRFAAGVGGIQVQNFAAGASGTIVLANPPTSINDATVQEGAMHSSFRDFQLVSENNSAGAGIGFETHTVVHVENVTCYYFGDEGFLTQGSADVPDAPIVYGNAALSTYKACHAILCGSHGFWQRGRDAAPVHYDTCDAIQNGGWGFFDESTYGAKYTNCHAATNTLGTFKQTSAVSGSVYDNCYIEGGLGSNLDIAQSATVIGGLLSGPLSESSNVVKPIKIGYGYVNARIFKSSRAEADAPANYPLVGTGMVYHHSASGLVLAGGGASNDLTFVNKDATVVATVGAGGIVMDFKSPPTLNGVPLGGTVQVLQFTGNQSFPGAANGNAFMYHHAGAGMVIYGEGTSTDLLILNKAATSVVSIPTNGTKLDAVVGYDVAGNQVVGARGAAVANATDAASAITQLNALLARCRAHGLIA